MSPGGEAAGITQMDLPIDFGRVGLGTPGGPTFAVNFVDDDVEGATDFRLQFGSGDASADRHEPVPALLLDLLRHGTGRSLAAAPATASYLKQPTRVQLRLLKPVEQIADIILRLTREPDDEGRTERNVRAHVPPRLDAVQHLRLIGRTAHGAQYGGAGVLKRNVEIGVMMPTAINGIRSSTCG